MAEILCRWVNEDVGTTRKLVPESLSSDLSNGCVYGDILSKCGLQENYSEFISGESSEAKLKNFTLLEATLQLLNIHLKPTTVREIMSGDGHSAIQLLYRLFVAVGNSRSRNINRQVLQGQKSSGRLRLENTERKWYCDRLKQQTLRQSDLDFESLIQSYEDKRLIEEEKLRRRHAEHEKQGIQRRQEMIAAELVQGRAKREQQASIYKNLQYSSQQKADSKLFTSDSKRPRRLEILTNMGKLREISQVEQQIHEFERTHLPPILFHSNEDDVVTSTTGDNTEHSTDTSATLSSTDKRAESDESITTQTQNSFTATAVGDIYTSYINRLHEGRRDREQAEKERACRRRRVLAEHLQIAEIRAEHQRDELLVSRLMRQTQQEKRIATQFTQVKENKAVLQENRAIKQKQIEEQRQKDFQEALDREAQLVAAEKELYWEQVKHEQDLHRKLLEQKKIKLAEKNKIICTDIIFLLSDLACKIVHYRDMTVNKVPKAIFDNWKTLVLAGFSPFDNCSEEDYPVVMEDSNKIKCELIGAETDQRQLLDEHDFLDYLNLRGAWSPGEDDLTQSVPTINRILGYVIHRLYTTSFPAPSLSLSPQLPSFHLSGCVLGPPFSGKSAVLKKLATQQEVILLDPSQLVQEALQAYKNNETEKYRQEAPTKSSDKMRSQSLQIESPRGRKHSSKLSRRASKHPSVTTELQSSYANQPPISETKSEISEILPLSGNTTIVTEVPTARAKLGERVLNTLKKGNSLDDTLIVDILIHKIKSLPNNSSWLIDGFPRTFEQAKLIEKQLSGFESPPNPPKLSSTPETRSYQGYKTSLLAPSSECARKIITPKSGFNIVVIFSIHDDLTIRRALGQQINKHSKDKYHIEFNPAPSNIAPSDILRDTTSKDDMLLSILTSYNDNAPLIRDWYGQFHNIVSIDASKSVDGLYDELEKQVLSSNRDVSIAPPDNILITTTTNNNNNDTNNSNDNNNNDISSNIADSITENVGIAIPDNNAEQLTVPVENLQIKTGDAGWEYNHSPVPSDISQFLAELWEAMETHYIEKTKDAFSSLRTNNHIFVKYIYNSRKDFVNYLKRPDHKQTFVNPFIVQYNSLKGDIIRDKEVKAEYHQKIEDLKKEGLWEISDKRKRDAEAELKQLQDSGWLEYHIGLITNIYISLFQGELLKQQDTFRVLHDYYETLRGKQLTELAPSVNMPVLELSEAVPVLETSSGTKIPQSSLEEDMASPVASDEQKEKYKEKLIIVPRYEYKSDINLTKDDKTKKKQDRKSVDRSYTHSPIELKSEDRDENEFLQAYSLTCNVMQNLVHAEYILREECDAGAPDKDKKDVVEDTRKPTPTKKEPKVAPGKEKSSGKSTPSQKKGAKDSTPEPLVELAQSPDVKTQRKPVDKLLAEFLEAIKIEEQNFTCRLQLLREQGLSIIRERKAKYNENIELMTEWVGKQFNEEMNSIDHLCDYFHQTIENEMKMKNVIDLTGTQFLIELDYVNYTEPPPIRPTTPREVCPNGFLTVSQLLNLSKAAMVISPLGMVSAQDIQHLFVDNTARSDVLIEYSEEQLSRLLAQMSWDTHLLNWKTLIACLAQPYPIPTTEELIETLKRFRLKCLHGQISRQDYLDVPLWFEANPCDKNDTGHNFNRHYSLRLAFFDIFSNQETGLLDYKDMLLYFCANLSSVNGFINAMSVIKAKPLLYPDEMANKDDESDIIFSKQDVYTVLYHNRIDATENTFDLDRIFSEAGINELSYIQLLSNPIFLEIMHTSNLYQLYDPSSTVFNLLTAKESDISLHSEATTH